MNQREAYNQRVLGKELHDKVNNSKILLVGAGGIGCELLKNLVMSGFKEIQVIDLDTIDVSNLNRQFLFQRQHVQQAKAHVAKESAHRFNPSVKISSMQANIKEPQFDVSWFKQFTMVLNALDNLDARRHVNSMCLAANVPLVESGTQGYFGQAYIIKKDVTECFDCQVKPTPKTFPVCTIRSTPSAPIHCIVWAKSFLFSQLFGNSDEEEAIEEDTSAENANEVQALKRETEELKAIKDAAGSSDYTQKIFNKVYTTDIKRLLSMEDMWKNKDKKPTPLAFDTLQSLEAKNVAELSDRTVWDLKENFEMFKSSATALSQRLLGLKKKDSDTILVFDKDDEDAMNFVTATANLRAHVFEIEKKTLFDVKSIAGNIIPAIATTNAVIAGLVILKAFGILRGQFADNKRVYLHTESRLIAENNDAPNNKCPVCRSNSITVQVDLENTTLGDLVNNVITKNIEDGGLGLAKDDISILSGNNLLYEFDPDDEETDEVLENTLSSFKLRSGSILRITTEDYEVDVIFESSSNGAGAKLMDQINALSLKRKLEETEEEEEAQEERNVKPKITHTVVDDVVILDEDEEEDSMVILEDDDDVIALD